MHVVLARGIGAQPPAGNREVPALLFQPHVEIREERSEKGTAFSNTSRGLAESRGPCIDDGVVEAESAEGTIAPLSLEAMYGAVAQEEEALEEMLVQGARRVS